MRGRGLFRATQLAMLERAFTAGARRVEWHIDAEHADLTGALTRLGASADGILRQWQKRADGVWADIAVFSLLRSEWPGVQARLTADLAELATAA
jgi:RimJ/RimL family protein N-acetyltransferase